MGGELDGQRRRGGGGRGCGRVGVGGRAAVSMDDGGWIIHTMGRGGGKGNGRLWGGREGGDGGRMRTMEMGAEGRRGVAAEDNWVEEKRWRDELGGGGAGGARRKRTPTLIWKSGVSPVPLLRANPKNTSPTTTSRQMATVVAATARRGAGWHLQGGKRWGGRGGGGGGRAVAPPRPWVCAMLPLAARVQVRDGAWHLHTGSCHHSQLSAFTRNVHEAPESCSRPITRAYAMEHLPPQQHI